MSALRGLMARISRNIGIHGSGLSTSTDPRTSAGDHHSGWSNLQEKVGRCTLDLQLGLDSYSGALGGPRASPERLLSLQRNVTNVMARGSMSRYALSVRAVPRIQLDIYFKRHDGDGVRPRTYGNGYVSPALALCCLSPHVSALR